MSIIQKPNERQIAGNHYQTGNKYQLWDLITDINLNFLLGNAVKYIYRCKNKNGIEDLQKARHYVDKFFSLGLNKIIQITGSSYYNLKLINTFLEKESQLSDHQSKLIYLLFKLSKKCKNLDKEQRIINTLFFRFNENLKDELNLLTDNK
jgi:hypothetical protein